MKLNNFLAIITATSTICLLLSAPAIAQEDNTSLGASPAVESYQAPLKSLATEVLKGETLMHGAKKAEGAAILKRANVSLDKKLKELPRGYHDEIYTLLGISHEAMGDVEAAIENYDSSLRLASRNPKVVFRRAGLLKAKGDCNSAARAYEETLWLLNSNKHEVLYELAGCQQIMGQSEEASKTLEKAYQAKPDHAPTLKLLVANRKMELADAETPAEKAEIEAAIAKDLGVILSVNPNDRDAGIELTELLLQNADPLIHADRINEAGAIAMKFAEQSSYKDADSVRLLFDAQIKKGDLNAAEKTVKLGLDASPTSQLLLDAQKQFELQRSIDKKSIEETASVN